MGARRRALTEQEKVSIRRCLRRLSASERRALKARRRRAAAAARNRSSSSDYGKSRYRSRVVYIHHGRLLIERSPGGIRFFIVRPTPSQSSQLQQLPLMRRLMPAGGPFVRYESPSSSAASLRHLRALLACALDALASLSAMQQGPKSAGEGAADACRAPGGLATARIDGEAKCWVMLAALASGGSRSMPRALPASAATDGYDGRRSIRVPHLGLLLPVFLLQLALLPSLGNAQGTGVFCKDAATLICKEDSLNEPCIKDTWVKYCASRATYNNSKWELSYGPAAFPSPLTDKCDNALSNAGYLQSICSVNKCNSDGIETIMSSCKVDGLLCSKGGPKGFYSLEDMLAKKGLLCAVHYEKQASGWNITEVTVVGGDYTKLACEKTATGGMLVHCGDGECVDDLKIPDIEKLCAMTTLPPPTTDASGRPIQTVTEKVVVTTSDQTGLYIGLAVAGVVLVVAAIIIFIGARLYRQLKEKKEQELPVPEAPEHRVDATTTSGGALAEFVKTYVDKGPDGLKALWQDVLKNPLPTDNFVTFDRVALAT